MQNIILCIGIFIMCCGLSSQTLLTHTYSISDGLASPTINGVSQDHSGRMWFATLQGLTYYDGVNWQNFTTRNGLPSPRYYHIMCDTKGNVYALSWDLSEGITHFDGQHWLWIEFKKDRFKLKPGLRIRITSGALCEAGDGTYIAVGTMSHGLFIYSVKDKRWSRCGEGDKQIRADVYKVTTDRYQHRFYMAASTGAAFVEPAKSYKWVELPIRLPSLPLYSIAVEQQTNRVSPDGTPAQPKLWLTGGQWIGTWDKSTFSLLYKGRIPGRERQGEYHQVIILPDGFGGLWVGGKNSLLNFSSTGDKRHFRFHSSLHALGTYSLFYDREYNLWVGSPNGLSKITGFCFENYSRGTGLYDDEVSAIMELGDDQLIFGHNGAFTFLKDDALTIRGIRDVDTNILTGARVLDMCRDKNGNAWAAVSRKGFVKITPARDFQWFIPANAAENSYSSVVVDREGTVWGAAGKKFFRFDGTRFVQVNYPGKFPSIRRLFVFKQRKNEIFIVSLSGVFSYNTKQNTLQVLGSKGKSGSNSYYSLFLDKEGHFLVGGYDGLFKLTGDRVSRYSLGTFEVKVPVYFIVEDPDGKLWIGLDNGVVSWDHLQARHYTMEDGLLGTETNRAAGYVDKQGRVWIGTELGVARYYKERDRIRNIPPLLDLVSIEINSRRFPINRPLVLDFKNNDLTFHFRGTSFLDETQITYKYKLVGFEDGWQSNSKPSLNYIRYTNLSPGTYTFYIQAFNRQGVQSRVVQSHEIVINRPFNRTWWFYLIVLASSVFLIALIINAISKNRYAIQLEEQVKLRTQQVKSTETEFRNIFNNAHDAILIFDPNTEFILDVNDRASDIYGFSRSELIGMSLEDLSIDLPRGKEKIVETLKHPMSFSFETSQYRKDRSVIHLEINAFKIDYKGKDAILSINRDITARRFNEKQLEKSLEEKDILLKEIHHRVKNNLQIISSLLDLQSDSLDDPNVLKIFQDSKNRIHSMALIHENLYQSGNLAQIDMQGYIHQLVDSFYSTYETLMGKVSFNINVENISLPMDSAIPIGLILTELLSNSLKHAFPGDRMGAISISLKPGPYGNLQLESADDGVGMAESTPAHTGSSLGLQLVTILARQLRGTVEQKHDNGTAFIITFPYDGGGHQIVHIHPGTPKPATPKPATQKSTTQKPAAQKPGNQTGNDSPEGMARQNREGD